MAIYWSSRFINQQNVTICNKLVVALVARSVLLLMWNVSSYFPLDKTILANNDDDKCSMFGARLCNLPLFSLLVFLVYTSLHLLLWIIMKALWL